MVEKSIWNAEEARAFLGISRGKIYQLIHQKGFPVLRIGRAVRIPKAALMTWIERQTEEKGSK